MLCPHLKPKGALPIAAGGMDGVVGVGCAAIAREGMLNCAISRGMQIFFIFNTIREIVFCEQMQGVEWLATLTVFDKKSKSKSHAGA